MADVARDAGAAPAEGTPARDRPAAARVCVLLPAALTAPEPAEELDCEAATVGELLAAVAAARPGLAGRLFYEGRPLVSVVLNGQALTPRSARATALSPGDRVALMPPVAGG